MTYEAPEPPKLAPGKPSGAPTVKRTVVTDDPNIRGLGARPGNGARNMRNQSG